MKLKKTLIIALFLLSLITISAVSATSDTDNNVINSNDNNQISHSTHNTNDITTNNYDTTQKAEKTQNTNEVLKSTDDGTFTSLQNKIDIAEDGSSISLENDYNYDDGFDTEGIKITKSLTINGNGKTINGKNKARIFKITKGSIILNNIKFSNGFSEEYGGAILATNNYVSLTINYCSFTDNKAKQGGALWSGGLVGLSERDPPKVSINSCSFTSNTATTTYGLGGAIYCGSTLTVKNSRFNNNIAGHNGGAIESGGIDYYGNWLNTDINNCIFTNNYASFDGGAVDCDNTLNLGSSTFTSNSAANGGAICCRRDGATISDLFVKNSKFINNKASELGGAIFCDSCHYEVITVNGATTKKYTYLSVVLEDSTFTGNSAETGGAIYNVYLSSDKTHNAKAIRCTFQNNKAKNSEDKNTFGNVVTTNCVFKDATTSVVKKATKITANKKTFKRKVKIKKYTSSLKSGKKGISKVWLYITIKGKKYKKTFKARTNTKGKATFKIKKLNKKGKYTATINFKGNKNYKKSSKKVKITIK